MPDVLTTTVPTAMGPVVLAATPAGVVRIGLPGADPVTLRASLGPLGEVRDDPAAMAPHAAALRTYLDGDGPLELPLDWSLTAGFRREILRALATVPPGEVVTYTGLAAMAGRPRAVRAAGTACATNPLPIVVPCHRVVRADGLLGGYGGGVAMKAWLLGLEGVEVVGEPPRVVAFGQRTPAVPG
jgi:methylated-DNA-[protein]-cysteine S-methyltransferase